MLPEGETRSADNGPIRIAYVAAGAADMYCGSCLHANSLATALTRSGQQVSLVPIYTPLRTDEPDMSVDRVFLSGINIYLQQRWPVLAGMPAVLHHFLESRWLLALVGRLFSATDATGLGPLAVSVLDACDGPHAGDVGQLIDFLEADVRPQIVQLPNSMLIGLAGPIRRRLKVPVLCGLQGEDLFIEGLPPEYRRRVCHQIGQLARDVDGFVATSTYGADSMSELVGIDRARIHVVPLGLNLEGHGPRGTRTGSLPTVGYLARICPEKGFGLAVDAFIELSRRFGAGRVCFRAAGYLDRRDNRFLGRMRSRIKRAGLAEVFHYAGEVSRKEKIDFLNSIDLLSVPSPYKEPKGLYVLEALANGVPVVQPRHGAFPELIQATGGGLLVEPDSATALAAAWQQLLEHPEQREALGRRGLEAVRTRFSDKAMAEATLALYRRFLESEESG